MLEGRKEVRAKRERHSTGEQAGEEKREGVCLGREKDKEKKEKKSKRGERGERAEGRCVCVRVRLREREKREREK